jgi:hypothetical protein
MALLLRRAEIQAKFAKLEKSGMEDRKQKEQLQQELDENLFIEKEADKLLTAEQERTRQYLDWKIRDEILAEDLTRAKEFHKSLVKRLNEAAFVKEYRGYDVVVINAPRTKKLEKWHKP